jgi:phosphate transport system substrate-binding protein
VSIIATSRRVGAFALATAFVVGACSSSATTAPAASAAASAAAGAVNCVTGSITASGSTALQPLADAAGKAYQAACPNATIQVQGGGSGTGLTQVLQGAVQIGDSDVTAESKLQPADAATLVDHQVASQGWIMVNNPDVTGVTNLTTDQAKQIWTGAITNWKDVGGPDMPLVVMMSVV